MKEITGTVGNTITHVAEKAIAEAQTEDVFFNFNGVCVTVTKDSTVDSVYADWEQLMDKARIEYENSPQRAIDKANREQEAKDARQKYADTVKAVATMTELELEALEMPRPHTIKELDSLIKAFSTRSHDYGTCVYAMSIVAEAGFNLMAHTLGVTGFQASCADLDIIKRTRGIDGPFAIIKGNDMLYPQYDIREKVEELLESWKPWAKEEAQKLLDKRESHAHPEVIQHWRSLAN